MKVGTSPRAARQVGGKLDFGIRKPRHTALEAGDPNVAERQAREDRVKGQLARELPRAGVDSREAGVGGHEAGPGSYSGGDVDSSITGVGFGTVAASGPDDVNRLGEAETTGRSDEFASGPPARGSGQGGQGGRRDRAGGATQQQVRGTTHDRSGDDTATGDASADRDAGRAGRGNPVGMTRDNDESAGAAAGAVDFADVRDEMRQMNDDADADTDADTEIEAGGDDGDNDDDDVDR
jgi:hypothetical protein